MNQPESLFQRMDGVVTGSEGLSQPDLPVLLKTLFADPREVPPPCVELPRCDVIPPAGGLDGVLARQHAQEDLGDLLRRSAMQINASGASRKESG